MQRKSVFLHITLTTIIAGCGGNEVRESKPHAHNVLLITLDTTRADRLGCYGYKQAQTPALDALAARGVVFDDAVAQVPLTLPSHASILTGRFPKEFGVRVNNQAAIGKDHPTLATVFKEKGYRTAAFVATFVLDSRFGLDRGFDVYDDEMNNVSIKTQPLDWEQPANIIADRSIAWLDADKSKPFFAWVHFYDPHDPYNPPLPFPKSYDGEIAFMDSQLRRLTDWIDNSGQKDRTLVVVVGDHGESFGEHGEEGHGMFLYHTSLHVPLIFCHPTLVGPPRRVANTVAAADVFPTILELMGWPSPEGLVTRSLVGALQTGQETPREIFSESDYVWNAYGWAQQRSFTSPDWKFISSARPELYDRKKDPAEKHNLMETQRPVAVQLSNQLSDFYSNLIAHDSGRLPPSAAATQAMAALGYVGGTSALGKDEFLTNGAADPKDKLGVVQNYKAARKLLKQEKYAEAAQLLKEAGEEAPDSVAIHAAHGMALVNAGRFDEALDVLQDKALKLDMHHQPALMSTGDAFFNSNRFVEAKDAFTIAVANDPLDPTAHYKLGKTLLRLGDARLAQAEFARAVELFPDFAEPHFELGVLLANAGQDAAALEHYARSVALKPDDPLARYNFGRLLLVTRKPGEAVEHLREATRLNPQYGEAWINLGIALLSSGKANDGKDALTRAAQIPSVAAEAHYNLGVAAEKENDPNGARRHFELVLQLNPRHPDAVSALRRLGAAPKVP